MIGEGGPVIRPPLHPDESPAAPDSLVHLIYASTATAPFAEAELIALLEVSRRRNEELGVSGILLHADGSFFQVLEGDAVVVDALYERIGRDPRHEGAVVIVREPIARRAFPDWSMGFASVSRETVAEIVGANDFFHDRSCFSEITPGRARKLLDAFGRGRWRASGPLAA